jgi:hypothetical protein
VSGEERLERARALLEGAGLPGACVQAVGSEGEIAALRIPTGDWERMLASEGTALAAALQRAGFRYVTLDLEDEDPAAAGS